MKKLLTILFLLALTSTAFCQTSTGNDSARYTWYKFQYGTRQPRFWADSALLIPIDTNYSKSGIARIGINLFVGNGSYWRAASSGTTVNPEPGIDSFNINQYRFCVYPHDGASQCYEWRSFATNGHISDDSARYVFTNAFGDSIFSIPTKLVHAVGVNGITITRGGTGPDGLDTVYYTFTGSVSGGSGISKVGSPAYGLTRTNDSTYIADTAVLTSQTRTTAGLALKADKSVTITPSTPLTGGGDLSANRSIGIDTTSGTATSAVTQYQRKKTSDSLLALINLKENALGNPSTNGYILSSTTGGTRSWIAPAAGGLIDTTRFSKYQKENKVRFPATWNAEGTSIAFSTAASSTALGFVNQVAVATRTTANNTAVASSSIRNMIFRRFTNAEVTNVTQALLLEPGPNDMYQSTSFYRQPKVVQGINTIIVNHFLDKFWPIDTAVLTPTGTWSSLATSNISSKSVIKGRGTPKKTSVLGSKITFTWNGSTLVIGTWGVDASHTTYGSFKVTIDGVVYVVYDMKGKADDWFYAPLQTFDERMPTTIVITGLVAGNHAVEIEALENKEIDLDYVGRLVEPAVAKPVVLLHVEHTTDAQKGTSTYAMMDSVNVKIDSLGLVWKNLGYPLAVVKISNYFDTSHTSDGVHPNDVGHQEYYRAVMGVLDTTGYLPTPYWNLTATNTALSRTTGGIGTSDTSRLTFKTGGITAMYIDSFQNLRFKDSSILTFQALLPTSSRNHLLLLNGGSTNSRAGMGIIGITGNATAGAPASGTLLINGISSAGTGMIFQNGADASNASRAGAGMYITESNIVGFNNGVLFNAATQNNLTFVNGGSTATRTTIGYQTGGNANNGGMSLAIYGSLSSANMLFGSGQDATTITIANSKGLMWNSGNWRFGTSSATEVASAKVEILSTTQGFLLPRMTKTQRDAISSPVAGLMIYQTDNTPGLRTYNGTNWMKYTEATD